MHSMPIGAIDWSLNWQWGLDGWILLAAILCAIASSLIGSFLVLRRMSMLGDAIGHAVLPGLAAAFFLSSSRSSIWMFAGAVIVGLLTAFLTEWIRGQGGVDEGASMGVVFTTLFAIGLLMIVKAADHVDLDPNCVLLGAIEQTPFDRWKIAGFAIPRVVVILGAVVVCNAVFVATFYKELKLASFDPGLADAFGFHSKWMHYLLMIFVAITAVASFESVGNILVLAMLVVPTATALLLSDQLHRVLLLSVGVGILSAVVGYIASIQLPKLAGFSSTSASGMMATQAGVFFLLAMLFSPSHGLIVRRVRRNRLTIRILQEDILAYLYRLNERDRLSTSADVLAADLNASRLFVWLATWRQIRRGNLVNDSGHLRLTEIGNQRAVEIVRSHRLWEQYLVDHAELPAARIHDKAESFEHVTDATMREELAKATRSPSTDPHGSPIPGARSNPPPTHKPHKQLPSETSGQHRGRTDSEKDGESSS